MQRSMGELEKLLQFLNHPSTLLTDLREVLVVLERAVERCREMVRVKEEEEKWREEGGSEAGGGRVQVRVSMHENLPGVVPGPPAGHREGRVVGEGEVERERHREEMDRSEEVVGDEGSGEEEVDDEIDIVVEEDGQVIKISPEELKKLRREFEENRLLESSPSIDLKVENEEKGMADGKKLQEKEEGRSDLCRDNLDSKYAEKVDKTYLCKVSKTLPFPHGHGTFLL